MRRSLSLSFLLLFGAAALAAPLPAQAQLVKDPPGGGAACPEGTDCFAPAPGAGPAPPEGLPSDEFPPGGLPGAGPGGRGGRLLRLLDTNGDGWIDAGEFAAGWNRRFERLDANHDGRISREEFATGAHVARAAASQREDRLARRFAAIDRNGDGTIDRAEWEAFGRTVFARMDRSGTGRVSVESLQNGRRGR